MNGYIALHRKFAEWEWYTDIPTKILFLHLLLIVNFKDEKFRGDVVKRGQYRTSIRQLSEETGLTVQQTRRALNNLQTTNEITIEATNKSSLITVVNYNKYQSESTYNNKQNSKQENKQTTNKEQTNNKQTTNQQINNDNKDNNTQKEKYKKKKGTVELVIDYLNKRANVNYKPSTKQTRELISARINDGYILEDFMKVIDVKCNEWLGTEQEKFLRPSTLFRPANFESYLNQKTTNYRAGMIDVRSNEFLKLLENGS